MLSIAQQFLEFFKFFDGDAGLAFSIEHGLFERGQGRLEREFALMDCLIEEQVDRRAHVQAHVFEDRLCLLLGVLLGANRDGRGFHHHLLLYDVCLNNNHTTTGTEFTCQLSADDVSGEEPQPRIV